MGIFAALVGALALIAAVVGIVVAHNDSGSSRAEPPAPSPTLTTTSPTTSALPAPTTPTAPPLPSSAATSADSVTYLDQYVHECSIAGSIQDTHDATIRGTQQTHAVNQTPNGYEGTAFFLGGTAHRFQANVGVRDSSGPGHRIRFRLLADGNELYDSGLIGSGEAPHAVEVSVEGIGTLIMAAYGDTGIGNATWGEARVTGPAKLSCPQ